MHGLLSSSAGNSTLLYSKAIFLQIRHGQTVQAPRAKAPQESRLSQRTFPVYLASKRSGLTCLKWKQDGNLREIKVMRRYHIQDREDYHKCVHYPLLLLAACSPPVQVQQALWFSAFICTPRIPPPRPGPFPLTHGESNPSKAIRHGCAQLLCQTQRRREQADRCGVLPKTASGDHGDLKDDRDCQRCEQPFSISFLSLL